MFEKIFYGTGFGRDRMSPARAGYLLLVWLLVPGFLVMHFYTMLVGMAFSAAFAGLSSRMNADITFRHPFFTWTGDIGFEDLRVRPLDADAGNPMSLQVKRVRFDLPNLGVMQGALAAASTDDGEAAQSGMLKVVNRLDHIGVDIDGLKFDELDGLPGALGYVGTASAAPLEAEGCVGDQLWVDSELPKLGISNPGVDLELTLANKPEAREVHVTGKLVSPQSSRAEFEQHYKAASLSAFLDAPKDSRIAIYERLAVQDEGFIAARDAYCAKRDGVDRETFRARHLAAVHRLLEAHGMRAPAAVEAVYLEYLQKGRLVLEANPSGTIRREDYHHYSVADQMAMYRGKISASGNPVSLQFEEVPARGIPESYEGSTWDLIAAEAAAPARAEGEEVDEEVEVALAPAKPVAPVPAAPSAPLVQAAAVPAPKPAPVAAAVATPAPLQPGSTTRMTSDGRPLASSLPPKKDQRRRGPTPMTFDELARHVGDRVEITTIYGERREGRVESVSGSTLRLRSSVGLGYAITNFERSKLRSIVSYN